MRCSLISFRDLYDKNDKLIYTFDLFAATYFYVVNDIIDYFDDQM